MDYSQLNFSSQESLFPEFPADVNPWDAMKTLLVVNYFGKNTSSNGMLAVNCIAIIILAMGIFLSFAILFLEWHTARRLNKSFCFIRRIERPEGIYFTVENSTFIPLTMLLYWACLIGEVATLMLVVRNHASLYNTYLWRTMPFVVIFIQGHGFAFSILIGGVITRRDLLADQKIKLPPAWALNFLQIALLIATVIASTYFATQTNKYGNQSWYLYEAAIPLLEKASASWKVDEALDPSLSEPAFMSLTELFETSVGIVDNLGKTLLVWLVVAGIPLVTLVIAAILLLRAVHVSIKALNADIEAVSTSIVLSQTTSNGQISTVAGNTQYKEQTRNIKKELGLRKPLRQLKNLRKTLAWRISVLSVVSLSFAAIILTLKQGDNYTAGSSNTQIDWLFYLGTIAFPWISIGYGAIVLAFWFRSAWRAWRETMNDGITTNQPCTSSEDHGQASFQTTGSSSFTEKGLKEVIPPLSVIKINHTEPKR